MSQKPVEKRKGVDEQLKLPEDVAVASFALYANPQEGFAKDAQISIEGFRNMLKLRAEVTGTTAAEPENTSISPTIRRRSPDCEGLIPRCAAVEFLRNRTTYQRVRASRQGAHVARRGKLLEYPH